MSLTIRASATFEHLFEFKKAQKWLSLKGFDRYGQYLDPADSKLSNHVFRQPAMQHTKLRRLLFLKYQVHPAAAVNRARYGAHVSKKCPFGCDHEHTQGHFLGACERFANVYTSRHDKVVKLIAAFLSKYMHMQTVKMNVSDTHTNLPEEILEHLEEDVPRRPDICCSGDATFTVVEVSICGNDNESVEERRALKLKKYDPLITRVQQLADNHDIPFTSVRFVPAIFGNCGRVEANFQHALDVVSQRQAQIDQAQMQKAVPNHQRHNFQDR